MPIVRFVKQNKETTVTIGTSILEAAQASDAPEGSLCGGVCACSTCHVYVLRGAELLSEMEDEENDILDKAFDVRHNSRLGCQAKMQTEGIVEVEISRESLEAYAAEHPLNRGDGSSGDVQKAYEENDCNSGQASRQTPPNPWRAKAPVKTKK